jgi:hypothetical protein
MFFHGGYWRMLSSKEFLRPVGIGRIQCWW